MAHDHTIHIELLLKQLIWLNKGNLIISKIDITGNEGMIVI